MGYSSGDLQGSQTRQLCAEGSCREWEIQIGFECLSCSEDVEKRRRRRVAGNLG